MMPVKLLRLFFLLLCFCGASQALNAQRFLADFDSTLFIKDTVRPLVKRFQNLSITGYMQPQFQVAQKQGIASFEGGNFSPYSKNRFMLRRARIKVDYLLPVANGTAPQALFTFQIDATERGVIVRDMFLRMYEPRRQNFSATMGLFGRPFGYEVNLSSGYRETPERGRMSQTLMPGERDMGAMFSYDERSRTQDKPSFKFDIGAFNGTGPTGITDFDSYKDLISRLMLKEWKVTKTLTLSGGLSFLYGGWRQDSKYKYEMTNNGTKTFGVDSSLSNIGAKALRQYNGADLQAALKHAWGKTEVRAEYWRGTQPGTATTTVSPASQPAGPTYLRKFDGAFFYFLQNIVNPNWELMVKYDWYDPNTKVSGTDIGKAGTNLTVADVKYSTLGLGLTRYFDGGLKMLAYYDFVRNEKTLLPDYAVDLPDNVFTLRMQLRF